MIRRAILSPPSDVCCYRRLVHSSSLGSATTTSKGFMNTAVVGDFGDVGTASNSATPSSSLPLSGPYSSRIHYSSLSYSENSGLNKYQVQRYTQHEQQQQMTASFNYNRTRSFSSMPPMKQEDDEDDNILSIPPNLKFDPRAISTPIYGLDKIGEEEEEEEAMTAATADGDVDNVGENEESKEHATNLDSNQAAEKQEDDEEDYDDLEGYDNEDEDEDDLPALYAIPKDHDEQRIQYAIPLPDRLHVPIIDFKSYTEAGSIHLSSHVFGADPIRTDILHRVVVYQRNKKRGRRNGGARTKTISEISGSGKKMRNQKGGGVARAGHKRPPHWRGGAKAHGPKGSVQNYETKLNKKVKRMGVRMALSQKLKEGNLIVVNSFEELGTHKTRVLANTLEGLGDIGGKYGCSAYIIDHIPEEDQEDEDGTLRSIGGVDINLHVASGNLPRVSVRNQQFLNVYDILKHEKLILSLSALGALEERYSE